MSTNNRSRTTAWLVGINGALALGAAIAAVAQPADPNNRSRGEYAMVSIKPPAGNGDVIFVIDASNQDMVGLRWDAGVRRLTGIGYRNLASDALNGVANPR